VKLTQLFFLVAVAFSALTVGCRLQLGEGTGSVALSVSMKQPAGAVTSIALVVSGPGMSTIARSLSPTETQATLEVPAGKDRIFTVLVSTRHLTFKGESSVDLLPGQSVAVAVQPTLAATPIIVPDPYDMLRLVQIDDMSGSGWTEISSSNLTAAGISVPTDFRPWDVDFDAHGRVYIANRSDGIVRIDDINAGNPLWFARGSVGTFQAWGIAVDRIRGWIYFTNGTVLNRSSVGEPAASPVTIDLSDLPFSEFTLYGLDTDSEGYLYIGAEDSGVYGVYKINPAPPPARASLAASPFLDGALFTATGTPAYIDVVVKDPYVYVTNQTGGAGSRILQLTKGLELVEGFGDAAPPLPTLPGTGDFYGPVRFVAILNKKITVIDEPPFDLSNADDRLVAFDDMNGLGWVTYGTRGSGTGQFDFFEFGE